MIRQAISCDICAAEKRQTNHWFVAYEQGGELRVSGWTSRYKLRPGSKHLCGQTCLHKLVDEFMAKSVAMRAQRAAEADEVETETEAIADTSMANAAAAIEVESSARLITPPDPVIPHDARVLERVVESSARLIAASAPEPLKPVNRPQPELVTMPVRNYPKDLPPLPADTLRYASRRWHAEAWERERERELRAVENHPETAARRRNSA